MKSIIVAGTPTSGKTTVIKHLIKKIKSLNEQVAFLKIDVQYADEDTMFKEEFDIPARKVEMLDVLALQHLARIPELDLHAGRTRGSDRGHFVHWKFPLGENGKHLAPDIPRRTDNSYPVTHFPTL